MDPSSTQSFEAIGIFNFNSSYSMDQIMYRRYEILKLLQKSKGKLKTQRLIALFLVRTLLPLNESLLTDTTASNINCLSLKFKHAVFCSLVPKDGVRVNEQAFAGTFVLLTFRQMQKKMDKVFHLKVESDTDNLTFICLPL